MPDQIPSRRRRLPSSALMAILVVAGLLATMLASPALGGPSLLSLKTKVRTALKVAKAADARSRKALILARQPGPQGPQGPQGPPGTNGTTPPGTGATAVDFREDPGVSRVILKQGGLVLTASCTAGPNVDVRAATTVDHSAMHVAVVRKGSPTAVLALEKNDFSTTSASQTITGMTDGANSATGSHLTGSLTFSTPTGTITTLTYASEQGAFGGSLAKGCWFGGTAVTVG
jgi:hypothetical protein